MNDINWFEVIDILAHEYSWSIDYIQTLSYEEIDSLIKKINDRKILEWSVECYIMNCAFNGKKPKFKSDEEETKEMSPEAFKKIIESIGGKVEKLWP